MTAADDDTKDGKSHIPAQLIPFIGITTASPEQLLYVEENGNGIQSSLTPQSRLNGMNWTKEQHDHWKSHRHGHHRWDDDLGDLIDFLSDMFVPFVHAMVNAGYDTICSSCSKFYNYFQTRGFALGHEWDVASAQMATATANAKKSPDADNFIALQRAHLQKMTVGTKIIMHGAAKAGKPADYDAAHTDNEQLVQFNQKLAALQEQLAGKTEAEKDEILQEAFPELWEKYKAGDLTAAAMGGSARPSQDLGGGIVQPFLQTLKDVFAVAGKVLYGDPNSDWIPAAAPKSQPQPT